MGTPRRRWGQHSPSWEHGGTSRQNDKAQPFWGDSPASRDLSQTHSGCADVSYSTMTINRRWSYKTDTQPLEYCVTTERVELTTQGIIWDTCWKLNQDEGRAGRQSMCPGDCYLCFKKSEEKKKRKVRYTPLRFHIISKGKRRNSTPGYLWGQSRGWRAEQKTGFTTLLSHLKLWTMWTPYVFYN